jgi:hypothetical protein
LTKHDKAVGMNMCIFLLKAKTSSVV